MRTPNFKEVITDIQQESFWIAAKNFLLNDISVKNLKKTPALGKINYLNDLFLICLLLLYWAKSKPKAIAKYA